MMTGCIEKISVVRRGDKHVAMGGPEHGGGDPEEVFSVTGHSAESILKKRAMDEARRRGIKEVIGLNVDKVDDA